MRPIFLELTLLSGLKTWLQVSQIVSITRIGNATYVRCTDDFPNSEAANVMRTVQENPEYIFETLSTLTINKSDNFTNN